MNSQVQEYLSKFICDCIILFLEVFHMRYNEENWPKTFVIVKTPIFEMFVSIDRSGPKGIILSFAK